MNLILDYYGNKHESLAICFLFNWLLKETKLMNIVLINELNIDLVYLFHLIHWCITLALKLSLWNLNCGS